MRWIVALDEVEAVIKKFVGCWPPVSIEGNPLDSASDLAPEVGAGPNFSAWHDACSCGIELRGCAKFVPSSGVSAAKILEFLTYAETQVKRREFGAVSFELDWVPRKGGKLGSLPIGAAVKSRDLPSIHISIKPNGEFYVGLQTSSVGGPFLERALKKFPEEESFSSFISVVENLVSENWRAARARKRAKLCYSARRTFPTLHEGVVQVSDLVETVSSCFSSDWDWVGSVSGGVNEVERGLAEFSQDDLSFAFDPYWTNGQFLFEKREALLTNSLFSSADLVIPLGWTRLESGGVWFLVQSIRGERRGLIVSDGVPSKK